MQDKTLRARIKLLTALLIVLAAITSVLTNAVTFDIPEELKGWAWLLLGFIVLVTVLGTWHIADLQERREAKSKMQGRPPSYARKVFLKNLRRLYVTPRLKETLYSKTPVRLHLRGVMDTGDERLADRNSIKARYDSAAGRLLILGAPGAGKTTLLLELAEVLINEAESSDDDKKPLPIFLHLLSWAEKQEPFEDWLVTELWDKYAVSDNIARAWVNQGKLCLLLDGLDEVAAEHRAKCVAAIYAYLRKYTVPTVVCSREAEYKALAPNVKLLTPVLLTPLVIRPLTDAQIDAFLAPADEAVRVAYRKLHDDGDINQRNRFRTPLMLEVLVVTYGQKSAQDLKEEGIPSTEHDVWKAYVHHMVAVHRVEEHKVNEQREDEVRPLNTPYNIQQVERWLVWLATYMHQRRQSEFYVEKLQPDWLSGWAELSYKALARLLSGLGGGLFIGGAFAFLFGRVGDLNLALAGGLLFWLFSAAIFAVAYGVDRIEPSEGFRFSRSGVREGMIKAIVSSLFSPVGLWVVVGMLYGLLTRRFDELAGALIVWLIVWLIVGILGGLRKGLAIEPIEDADRLRPNQGIWQSARNGLRAIVLVCVILVVAGAVLGALWHQGIDGLRGGAALGLFLGIVLAPLTGMVGGWQACLLHMVLRLVLSCNGSMPANYVRFLDYASERILLHKVGGRYIFMHRLLLEYFRSLDANSQRS